MAKDYWRSQVANRKHSKVAKLLGISEDDLSRLTYDIDENTNRGGYLYGYSVIFYGDDNDPEIMARIKGLEEGYYVSLEPWDLVYDDHDFSTYEEDELNWQISHSDQFEMFNKQLSAVTEIIKAQVDESVQFNLLVMLHGHIVSAFEHFLSSTFIHNVINSDVLIRKLIETDPEFKNRKFTLSEIYSKHDELKHIVAEYLNGIIFHNIHKVRPMFLSVLSLKFEDEDIEWLVRAIILRHDCAHRAGYDKAGDAISVTTKSIYELISKCEELAERIDDHMSNLNSPGHEELLKDLQEVSEIFKS